LSARSAVKGVARPVAKGASRMFTRPTARFRPLPDFLIIGGQRCGTTSLYRYLARHPGVLPAVLNKGVHYFDTGFDRSLAWYRSHFPSDLYRALVRWRHGAERVITGEGSPYYIFHPLAAARIADVIPGCRSILILRDPVERAYSHYQHEVARGFESLSFEEALELEDERLDGEERRMVEDPTYYSFSHQHHSYAARGLYLQQIERWLRSFPRERLMIVRSTDMFSDPDATVRAVERFLGIEELSLPPYEKMNARSYSSMSEGARAFLESRFRDPDRELAAFLGQDPGWDRSRNA
jgi:hypothetical protein